MEIDEIKEKFENHEERLKELENKFERGGLPEPIPTKDISDIEGDEITLIKFSGEKTEGKTQNIVLLTLLEYKEKLDKTKITASELRRNVAINHVPIENFATHLNKLIPQHIRRFGKPKSNKTTYKLTIFGEAEAKKIKKQIVIKK